MASTPGESVLFSALTFENGDDCGEHDFDIPPEVRVFYIVELHFHALLIGAGAAGICLPVTGQAGGHTQKFLLLRTVAF